MKEYFRHISIQNVTYFEVLHLISLLHLYILFSAYHTQSSTTSTYLLLYFTIFHHIFTISYYLPQSSTISSNLPLFCTISDHFPQSPTISSNLPQFCTISDHFPPSPTIPNDLLQSSHHLQLSITIFNYLPLFSTISYSIT